MTMKLVPGRRTLQTAVNRWRNAGGMPVATALGFLRQVLVPLAWMHGLPQPIVHGDLKPDNVLLTGDTTLVLADFGLAAPAVVGSFGGAIKYQAPEVLLGQITGRLALARAPADMYSVGLLWYQLLTGKQPFDEVGLQALADDDMKAYSRAQAEARKWPMAPARPGDDDRRIAPPSEINEEMRQHPVLEQMLGRCLAERYSERYPNAAVLLRDIDNYLAGKSDLVMPTVAAVPTAPPAVTLAKKDPAALLQDARVLIERGEPQRGLSLIEDVVKQHPRLLEAHLALARAHAAVRQFDRARAACEEAYKLSGTPPRPEVLETLADIYEAQGQTGRAQGLRQQALQLRQKKR